MGLLENIFGDSLTRKARRVWKDGCQWNSQKLSATRLEWVGVEGLFSAGTNTFEHMSAHRALGRMDIIDRWETIVDEERVVTGPAQVQRWASMDSAPFWHALQVGVAQQRVVFNSELFWTLSLEEAGRMGNVEPFAVAPTRALHDYAACKEHKPHPDVGLWLHAKGLASMEYLRDQVERDYSTKDPSFGGCKALEPMAPDYVARWCVALLRDYGLSDVQKIGVVGQALRAFGATVWDKHLAPACAPFVKGMDIEVLKVLCHEGDHPSPLGQMVACFTQHGSQKFHPHRMLPSHEGEDPTLRMLVELAPPQNRIDLYFLACRAKQAQESGFNPQETFELPALGQ